MSFLSNIIKDVAPVVATVAPFVPGGQAVAAVAAAKAAADQRAAIKYQQELARSNVNMAAMYPSGFDPVTGNLGSSNTTTQSAGNRGFVGTVTDFFSGAGEVVKSAFGSGIPQLLGFGRPRGVSQQPAITSVTNVGAQESQGSGSIQAGMGSLLPQVVGAARGLLKSPVGQILTGTGIGLSLIHI